MTFFRLDEFIIGYILFCGQKRYPQYGCLNDIAGNKYVSRIVFALCVSFPVIICIVFLSGCRFAVIFFTAFFLINFRLPVFFCTAFVCVFFSIFCAGAVLVCVLVFACVLQIRYFLYQRLILAVPAAACGSANPNDHNRQDGPF